MRYNFAYLLALVLVFVHGLSSAHRKDVETAKTFFTKPAGCSANQFAYDIAKAGTLSCSTVSPSALNSFDSPSNGECLTYRSASTNFEWAACGTGGGGSGDVTDVGPGCSSGACLTNNVATSGTNILVWEGTTIDLNQIRLAAPEDPGGSYIITLPEQTGTVCTDYSVCNGYQAGPLTGDVTTSGATATLATVTATKGGTGLTSYTAGNILYASASTTISALPTPAATARYLTGGTASGSAPSWTQVSLTSGVTGTLPEANGGTGLTSLGASVATFLGTPSSANLASAVTGETGTGALVFGTDPTITLANGTGLPLTTGVTGTLPVGNGGTGLTSYTAAGQVIYSNSTTTIAALATPVPTSSPRYLKAVNGSTLSWDVIELDKGVTGIVKESNGGTGLSSLGTGVATFLGTPSSANLASAVTGKTGTGALVFGTAPTITLANGTGLPLTTGVTGTLAAGNGGTGLSSYTAGNILYANPSASLAALPTPAPTASPSFLQISGTTVSWGKVPLDTGVTGTLPAANGGTGSQLVKFSGATGSEKTYTLPNSSVPLSSVSGGILPNPTPTPITTVGTTDVTVAGTGALSIETGVFLIGSVQVDSVGATREWTCCIHSGGNASTTTTNYCSVFQVSVALSPATIVTPFAESVGVPSTRHYDYKCKANAGTTNQVSKGRITYVEY